MLYPATSQLLEHADSRYTLVVMVSKRARQLLRGSEPLVNSKSKKAVSIAVEEIAEGLISFTRPEETEEE